MNDLTKQEMKLYFQQITSPVRHLGVRIDILDGNEKVISSLSDLTDDHVEDGQVDWDDDQPVKTSMQARIYDPDRELAIEAAHPRHKNIYPDRFIRVYTLERVPAITRNGGWTRWPRFTGPVNRFIRSGSRVTLSALGKEALHAEHRSNFQPYSLPKRLQIDEAIRRILRRAGEGRMHISSKPHRKLNKKIVVPRGANEWEKASHLADSLNWELIYDELGIPTAERRGRDVAWTFRYSDTDQFGPATLLDWPDEEHDFEALRNTIKVLGRIPKKGKKKDDDEEKRKTTKRPNYTWKPHHSHPLSPHSLKHHGEPQHFWEIIENDQIRTQRQAKDLAERVGRRKLALGQGVQFEAVVMHHLSIGSEIRVEMEPDRFMTFPLVRWSQPLVGLTMPVGTHRMMRPGKHKKKRHR